MTNVLLVDSYNSLFQLLHVQERDVFWRFTTDLRNILMDLQIHKVIMCCDAGESKYRLKKYPFYKGDRRAARAKSEQEDPAEKARRDRFMADARVFLDECPMFGMEVVKCPGVEADDIIAYFVQHADLTKFRLGILSSDTDLFQLLRPNVVQRAYSDKMKFKPLDLDVPKKVWINTRRFNDVYGLEPKQWVAFKAIAGDSGDSIYSPGGLGDTFALRLVQTYGDLDTIFKVAKADQLDIKRLTKKAKAALASKEGEDMVRFNVELVSLLYTPEVEEEIFAPWRDRLDDVLARLADPPVLDVPLIKEKMFEGGKVKLYHEHTEWLKPFQGFGN